MLMNPIISSSLWEVRFNPPIGLAIGFSASIFAAVGFSAEHPSSFRRMVLNVEFQTADFISSENVSKDDIECRLGSH